MSTITDPFAPKTSSRNAFGKDKAIGYVVTGVLVEDPSTMQQIDFDTDKPEFWDDGSPKMQGIVKLQTSLREDEDDDGIRTIYAKGGKATIDGGRSLQEAIRQAGIDAKARIAKGGTLTVKYVGDATPKNPKHSGQKMYVAKYTPPAAVDPFASDDLA